MAEIVRAAVAQGMVEKAGLCVWPESLTLIYKNDQNEQIRFVFLGRRGRKVFYVFVGDIPGVDWGKVEALVRIRLEQLANLKE